jgi:hypothetical protein
VNQGKRSLERPKCRWDHDIKMHLQDTGYKGVDWIHLSQDKVQFFEVGSLVILSASRISSVLIGTKGCLVKKGNDISSLIKCE